MTGVGPVNLLITNEVLCLLSYISKSRFLKSSNSNYKR